MSKKAPKLKYLSSIPFQVISFYLPLVPIKELIINIVLITITIITGTIGLLSENKDFIWLLSAFSFMAFIFSIKSSWTFNNTFDIESRKDIDFEKIQPSKKEESSGYIAEYVKCRNDAIIYSEKVNDYLIDNIDKIKLNLIDHQLEILNQFKNQDKDLYKNILLNQYQVSKFKGQEFNNDDKISLNESIELNNESLDVFKSSYYLSYLTNDLAMKKIYDISNESEKREKLHHVEFISKLSHTSQIKSINDSKLSNHIGANVIGITKDGFIQLWVQSKKALRSAGLLAPTGSGSLDYKDYSKIYNLNKKVYLGELVKNGMKRELLEESHGLNQVMDEKLIEEIKVIGYYRWVGKAGLPAFLGIAKLTVNQSQIKPNTDEVHKQSDLETHFDADTLDNLKESVDKLLKEYSNNLSVPLYANLVALKNIIHNRPEYLSFLFNDNNNT